MAEGPRSPVFLAYFGSAVTTLGNMALIVVVSFSMAALSNEQLTRDLSTRATRDGLTGLLNRAEFLRLATAELRRRSRTGTPVSLILADLDHFKTVNDRYGHTAGDSALQSFAAACMDSVRSTDLVGRYGGEEFILLRKVPTPRAGPELTVYALPSLRPISTSKRNLSFHTF